MRRTPVLTALAVSLLAAGGAAALTVQPAPTIRSADGKAIGYVGLAEGPTGLLITVQVEGLKPGWHGMHLHAVGNCSGAGFKAAGAHVSHAGAPGAHGLLADGGPEFGDLPNLWVGADGKGAAQVFSTNVTRAGMPGRQPLNDSDGTALVIHEAQDDQQSQPIGGAGARVACAVIDGPAG